jgi:glycosyltransferase involved in cell wall biosynthesis
MDVSVVVASFGSQEWVCLACSRAVPSALAEGVPVIYVHGLSLHGARNAGLAQVETEHVVFVDADDELEPGYIEAMASGSCDLRAPAVRYIRGGRPRAPYVPRVASHHHDCTAECVTSGAGNWLVVGTCARTDLLRETGGWREWDCYEDFDLWMRVLLLGATVEAIPAAVYRAHWRADSRNRAPAMVDKNRVHHEIVAANLHAAT